MSGPSAVSSSSPNYTPYEPEAHESTEPQMCIAAADGTTSTPSSAAEQVSSPDHPPDGVDVLVSANDGQRAKVQAFLSGLHNDEHTPATARNNAERTAGQQASGATADAGSNAQGDVVYAAAALTKGQLSDGSVEVGSAYAQVGVQNEVGFTGLRTEIGTADNHVAAEGFKVEGHFGAYNPDGSVGVNAGGAATLVGGELQLSASGNSVTLGASFGLGLEGSVGGRDADADGHAELCARISAGPVTVGACFEPGGWLDAVRP